MKFVTTVLCASALFLIAGCGAPPIPAQPPAERAAHADLERMADQPLTCTAGNDCDEKWMRAEVWVKKNSTYSLKLDTDTTIQTAGPIVPTTDSAFTVQRVPAGAGHFAITFDSSCGRPGRCVPTALELKAGFIKFVNYGF